MSDCARNPLAIGWWQFTTGTEFNQKGSNNKKQTDLNVTCRCVVANNNNKKKTKWNVHERKRHALAECFYRRSETSVGKNICCVHHRKTPEGVVVCYGMLL